MEALLQFSVVQSDILGTPERRAVLTAKLFLFFCIPNTKAFLGEGAREVRRIAVRAQFHWSHQAGGRGCLEGA